MTARTAAPKRLRLEFDPGTVTGWSRRHPGGARCGVISGIALPRQFPKLPPVPAPSPAYVIDLGVTVNADHPNVAKLFIVFQHTKIGQKLLWKHGAYDLEIYEGSKSKVLIDEFRNKYPKAKFLISTAQRAEQQEKDGINMRKFQKKFKKILRGRRRK